MAGPSDPRGGRPAPRAPLEKRLIATNRKARHDYAIAFAVEAGLQLLGSEVKSLRNGSASLQDGYARFENDDLWLLGVHVPPLPQASYLNHEPTRKRKCLLHRRELKKLEAMLVGKGTTIVPLSLYFKGAHVKVELGVGRGKTRYDKREDLKKKSAEKDMRKALRRR